MAFDWRKLTELTQGKKIEIDRVRVVETGIAIDGPFELPPIAQLTIEDQVFMIAFLKTHGSIKEMERLFGVSYPTIKNRLNRIAEQFDYVEIRNEAPPAESMTQRKKAILDALQRGKISAAQATEELKRLKP